jgi:HK97 family phage prohead protease
MNRSRIDPSLIEYSTFGAELTGLEFHDSGNRRTMVGYASAFNFPIPGDNGETIYIRQGAFKKTLSENRDRIQVLYHHGLDPQIGSKPLGVPAVMAEDKTGLWTETPLAETSYNDEIVIPLLRSGALRSMSIAFAPMERVWSEDRTEVEYRQIALGEFGPTPFPRNMGSSAALHSTTLLGIETLLSAGESDRNLLESSSAGSSASFGRTNTGDPDRSTEGIENERSLERFNDDLERQLDKIRALRG